ncbi:hypothetical protein B0H13DRAFT_1893828 [Mycena leptocephala]|nr:hypothetical protein B0H13DRAFT_1893828 [Mycena leptocephala]
MSHTGHRPSVGVKVVPETDSSGIRKPQLKNGVWCSRSWGQPIRKSRQKEKTVDRDSKPQAGEAGLKGLRQVTSPAYGVATRGTLTWWASRASVATPRLMTSDRRSSNQPNSDFVHSSLFTADVPVEPGSSLLPLYRISDGGPTQEWVTTLHEDVLCLVLRLYSCVKSIDITAGHSGALNIRASNLDSSGACSIQIGYTEFNYMGKSIHTARVQWR